MTSLGGSCELFLLEVISCKSSQVLIDVVAQATPYIPGQFHMRERSFLAIIALRCQAMLLHRKHSLQLRQLPHRHNCIFHLKYCAFLQPIRAVMLAVGKTMV